MSSIVISGDTSGSITLSAPAVSGTNTATLPAATGTVMVSGNMPTFFAYASSTQSITANTRTKIQYNNKLWDTNSCYDATTNYRFTPTVAGYYLINATVTFGSVSSSYSEIFIYKNGTNVSYGAAQRANSSYNVVSINSQVYCNGTTDYIEIYADDNATVGTIVQSSPLYFTYWSGVLVRAA